MDSPSYLEVCISIDNLNTKTIVHQIYNSDIVSNNLTKPINALWQVKFETTLKGHSNYCSKLILIFFSEEKKIDISYEIYLAHNSHEMSSPIFWENILK